MNAFTILVLTKLAEPDAFASVGTADRKRNVPKRGAKPERVVPRAQAAPVAANDPARVPPPERNWRSGQYTPNLAMRQALARAHEVQPALVGLSSTIRKEYLS